MCVSLCVCFHVCFKGSVNQAVFLGIVHLVQIGVKMSKVRSFHPLYEYPTAAVSLCAVHTLFDLGGAARGPEEVKLADIS